MSFFALLMLGAAASIPGPVHSVLVAKSHAHHWIRGADDEQHTLWFDEAFLGQADIEGRIYPTLLVRSYLKGGEGKVILDSEIAVNCAWGATAILSVWNSMAGLNSNPEPVHDIRFSDALLRDDTNAERVMQLACPKRAHKP
ncbi:MAG TPA: hypothetical protein VFS87_08520 [Qipengyuania sp.]|nr:hypothetical protein [Qipengyuania sp.]